MKLSKFKQIVREETASILNEKSQTLNEGVVDSIISFIVDKIIKTKYKKYFDSLHNDPEYKEALKGLKNAADRINDTSLKYTKSYEAAKSEYDKYAKKYGKEAAQRLIDKTYSGKSYERWKPKY